MNLNISWTWRKCYISLTLNFTWTQWQFNSHTGSCQWQEYCQPNLKSRVGCEVHVTTCTRFDTVSKEGSSDIVKATLAESSRVTSCPVSSLVDHFSRGSSAVAATILAASSLNPGKGSQENQGTDQKSRELHVSKCSLELGPGSWELSVLNFIYN